MIVAFLFFLSFSFFFFFFWPHHVICRILVPWPGNEPVPSALGVWSLNHRAVREVPQLVTVLVWEVRSWNTKFFFYFSMCALLKSADCLLRVFQRYRKASMHFQFNKIILSCVSSLYSLCQGWSFSLERLA